MPEAGNIVVIDEYGNAVFLYTHERAEDRHQMIREALNYRERGRNGHRGESTRWRIGAYLARVVFACLTRGSEDGVLAFGVSATRPVTGVPELHLDVRSQEVREVEVFLHGETEEGPFVTMNVVAVWSFEKFAAGALPAVMHDEEGGDVAVPR